MMRPKFLLPLVAVALSSCSLGPNSQDWVQVKVALPQKDLAEGLGLTSPTTVDAFDCYAVNVYGQGIGSIPSSQNCSYPGVTSTLATSNQASLNLSVPSGSARTIQMIGVVTGAGCNTAQRLQDLMIANASSPSSYSLSLIGSSTADLFSSTSVTIQNTFVSGTSTFPFNCTGFASAAPSVPSGPVVLPLVGATIGLNLPTASSVPVALNAAPFYSGTVTTLSASDLTAITNASNATAYGFASTSIDRGSRMDLIYSLAGVDATKYTSIKVLGIFGGTSFGGDGAKLSVWDNVSQAWVTDATTSNTSTTAVAVTGTMSATTPTRIVTPASVASSYFAGLTTPVTLTAGGQYMFVTINTVGHNISGTTQDVVKYVQVSLVP